MGLPATADPELPARSRLVTQFTETVCTRPLPCGSRTLAMADPVRVGVYEQRVVGRLPVPLHR